jgi:hypothetical protein
MDALSTISQERSLSLGNANISPICGPLPAIYTLQDKNVFGLQNSANYSEISENFYTFLCRRCFVYDCQDHGVDHVIPRIRLDPRKANSSAGILFPVYLLVIYSL